MQSGTKTDQRSSPYDMPYDLSKFTPEERAQIEEVYEKS